MHASNTIEEREEDYCCNSITHFYPAGSQNWVVYASLLFVLLGGIIIISRRFLHPSSAAA